MNKGARKEVERIIRAVFEENLRAGKLRPHVKRLGECKRMLEDSRDEWLAGDSSTHDILRRGSELSASGAVLYKKDAVAALQRYKATSSSQDVLFSSHDVLEEVSFCWHAARPEDAKRSAREGDGVETQRGMVEQ